MNIIFLSEFRKCIFCTDVLNIFHKFLIIIICVNDSFKIYIDIVETYSAYIIYKYHNTMLYSLKNDRTKIAIFFFLIIRK